jgi:hypothetical protein
VALGHVFSENFGFPCQSSFHLLLHNHLHYHRRLAQEAKSGRSASSLTNQIIIIKKRHVHFRSAANMAYTRMFLILCLHAACSTSSSTGFEVFRAVVMNSTIFCYIKPCSPLKVNPRFVRTYRFHLQGRRISVERNQRESRCQAVAI